MKLVIVMVVGFLLFFSWFIVLYERHNQDVLVIGDSHALFSGVINILTGTPTKPFVEVNYICVDNSNYEMHLRVLPSAETIKKYEMECRMNG